MIIPEKTVAEVVAEASTKMSDPNYSAVMVGSFVQTQKTAAQYISAHERELGGADGVVTTIFHAALIALSFQRAENRSVRLLEFDDLNHVANGDQEAALRRSQPAVLEYITANIETDLMRQILITLTLAMDWAT